VSHGFDLRAMTAAALRVRGNAYAPYSKFLVGCIVQVDGEEFEGVNVENASFPLCVCAERNAIAAACAGGARKLEAVVVATGASPPSAPCGGCRQVLTEMAPDPSKVPVVAVNPQGEERRWMLSELLPDSFSGKELP